MKEVIIDGVRYVPAVDAVANSEAIIRGLLMEFWGVVSENTTLEEACRGVHVLVSDSEYAIENGVPFERVLENIAHQVEAMRGKP
jgi:hypothetical protein